MSLWRAVTLHICVLRALRLRRAAWRNARIYRVALARTCSAARWRGRHARMRVAARRVLCLPTCRGNTARNAARRASRGHSFVSVPATRCCWHTDDIWHNAGKLLHRAPQHSLTPATCHSGILALCLLLLSPFQHQQRHIFPPDSAKRVPAFLTWRFRRLLPRLTPRIHLRCHDRARFCLQAGAALRTAHYLQHPHQFARCAFCSALALAQQNTPLRARGVTAALWRFCRAPRVL